MTQSLEKLVEFLVNIKKENYDIKKQSA
jgi:hypothetical protein